MTCIIQKYGGSSVADVDKLQKIARMIADVKEQNMDIAVVVSAMGKTTDELLAAADALDGRDLPGHVARPDETGTDRHAVHQHAAGAAGTDPTAVFGAVETQLVAQHPQQRHVVVDSDAVLGAVDRDRDLH